MTITRHEAEVPHGDAWAALSAPLPPNTIAWRQDGRPISRDGRFLARFVAYIEANTVRERLDSVVPGEWDLTLELLPPVTGLDEDANQGACSFKAKLTILDVFREDVGTGKDYKQAATDAFKRAAVRFGIGHELYAYEQNWVQMDGDGKYAKPLEDPSVAYARRQGRSRPALVPTQPASDSTTAAASPAPAAPASTRADRAPTRSVPAGRSSERSGSAARDAAPATADPAKEMSCPKCGGRMWDNRFDKRNPRSPDFKCRDRKCDGVIWPEKPAKEARA